MARKLSKWCSGCKCSTCRWQGNEALKMMKYMYGVDRDNPIEAWTWTDGILDAIIRRKLKPKLIAAGRNQFTGEKMKKT